TVDLNSFPTRRSSDLTIRRDDRDVELVDLVELGLFRLGGARHAGELLIHAEVVLNGDRREGLCFLAHGHAFLRLDGLVEPVGPRSEEHTSELQSRSDL